MKYMEDKNRTHTLKKKTFEFLEKWAKFQMKEQKSSRLGFIPSLKCLYEPKIQKHM